MKPARLARGLYKTLKWLFLATLILILIAAGALYFLLGSDSGYRQLPDLIARFTPYTLEYDTLDGHLLGDQRWQNLHLHGAGLDIRAAELRLNLRARDLLSGDVNIDALHLRDAQILLRRTRHTTRQRPARKTARPRPAGKPRAAQPHAGKHRTAPGRQTPH